MIVCPVEIAVTRPLGDTVATEGSRLIHSTVCGAVEGMTMAVNALMPPMARLMLSLFKKTAEGAAVVLGGGSAPLPEGCVVTVTVQVTYNPPCAVATMVDCPTETAVTVPSAETVATSGLELDHSTAWDALEGMVVAISL